MTHRERFHRIFNFQPVDRIPNYYFGSWPETKERWAKEGFDGEMSAGRSQGPQLEGMDPDWEPGLWEAHGLVNLGPIGDMEPVVLKEGNGTRILRSAIGEETLWRTDGSSIPHTLVHALEPSRESWNRFKRFLDANDARRFPDGWQQKAEELNKRDVVTAFMGGSFYGWIRGWMGVENISYLMYDDPELFEEMISTITDHFMTLMKPVLAVAKFDFVYFFEDCCGSHGPLFSPAFYRKFMDQYYRKLIRFYKENGVPLALVDSDGKSDQLIPCWLESGFDIIFPVEVGVWNASPGKLREQFGEKLRMLGGMNKNLIYGPEEDLRTHLMELKIQVDAGGYLPIPDHRIPPQVSYDQMRQYIQLFEEIFNPSMT